MRTVAIVLTLTLGACVPFEPMDDIHVVVVEKPVESGVPGNFGYFPNTRTPGGYSLTAYILGEPIPVNSRIPVRVIAVHDQVGNEGTINTIIATRHRGEPDETPPLQDTLTRASLSSLLVEVQDANGVSLGIRDQQAAYAVIANYRDAFRNRDASGYGGGADARRLIRSEP